MPSHRARTATPARQAPRWPLPGERSGGGQLASLSPAAVETRRSSGEDDVDFSIPSPQAMHLACNRARWHGICLTRVGGTPVMAKALLGHVGGPYQRMAAEL